VNAFFNGAGLYVLDMLSQNQKMDAEHKGSIGFAVGRHRGIGNSPDPTSAINHSISQSIESSSELTSVMVMSQF
jgi:hypothetical protein